MAKLYFYYSAMNAGKSTTLLQAAYNYRERGMNVLLYTPALDNRYGEGKIASRIGLESEAEAFSRNFDLFVDVRNKQKQREVHCVFVDEAQFLSAEQVMQLTFIVDRLQIPVLAYGLRTDFRGEPFEGSKYLLAWAEQLSEIKTVCPTGKKATMNARLDADGNRVWTGEQVDIGHHYIALSRREFQLDRISPIGYRPPDDDHSGEHPHVDTSDSSEERSTILPR